MINRLLKSSLLVLALAIAVCPSSLSAASLGKYLASIEKDQVPVAGKEYYVRHTFIHEKGTHVATNYWRGMLTPINSKVSLLSLDDKSMLLKLSSGETVKVENMPKFTRLDMQAVAKRMLASAPVPIEGFSMMKTNSPGLSRKNSSSVTSFKPVNRFWASVWGHNS